MSMLKGFITRQFIHYPPPPTTSFYGRTIIITGGNSGLGLEATRWMLKLDASRIIIACRNFDRGKKVAEELRLSTKCSADALDVWPLDLNSYASVMAFAERVKKELPRLDAVALNAGMYTFNFRLSEGNEETITTNVISTALLACLLHPKLRETAQKYKTQSHITITGSELYEVAKFKERIGASQGRLLAALNDKGKAIMSDRYNVSKLLVMFVVKQLAAMSPLESNSVIINVVAPGFCQSDLGREYDNAAIRILVKLMHPRPAEVGARTIAYGVSAGVETHGQYLPDCSITPTKGLTAGREGKELQLKVWGELSEKLEGIQKGVTVLI